MAMSWLRRNRKVLMGILVVVLMVAWGALPALRYLATSGGQTRGTIRGEPVGPRELQQASRQLNGLSRYGLLQRDRGIGGFIFAGQASRGASMEAVWRYLVLVREAEAAKIRVLDQEMQGLFGPESRLPRGDLALRQGLLNLIRISKLYAFRMDTVHTGMVEQWMEYYHQNYEAKLRLVELPPEIFQPLIEITDAEVREFYEERKEQPPEPRTGTAGYLAPERVRLEYAFAPVEQYKQQVTVSEEEITQYYEQNKSDYEIQAPEEPEEQPTPEAEETGAEQPPDEPEDGSPKAEEDIEEGEDEEPAAEENPPAEETPAENPEQTDEAGGAPDAAAEEGEGEGEGEEEEEEPTYQPLEEVRDEIRETLVQQKAEQMAAEQVEKALDDLESAAGNYVNEPLPLQQMAKRHGLRYAQPTAGDGRAFLSRNEIRSALPGGDRVARRLFEEELHINYTNLIETPEGPLVVQALERRETQPEPFEAIRGRVERDLRRHRAMEMARTLADKLKSSAAETSLEQAVAGMNERLVNLLGPPPKEEEPEEDEAAGGGETEEETPEEPAGGQTGEAEESEEEEREKPAYLTVRETDFVSLGRPRIEPLGGPRPTVVRRGLTLPEGELAVVVEAPPDPACYLIEKVEAREPDPAGFWMWMQQQQFRTMFMGPQQELQAWLDGLLEESPPPAEKEK